jgi:protoporphyrinogen oxidase
MPEREFEFVILGGGPTGLSVARTLIDLGVPSSSVLVLERESEPGGLCRSKIVDGYPVDIGGGHFLDTRNETALEFLFRFMPESEWNKFTRNSQIDLAGLMIDYPLEANLWQLPLDRQVDYLESIAKAGVVSGEEMPKDFESWVRWKFGTAIAEDYMLPYNRKIWSMDLDLLGIYWLYKLPDVSFRDTLKSCLASRPEGSLPAHGTFYYPKNFGYGEVWKRIADSLEISMEVNFEIKLIDIEKLIINGEIKARNLVSTIPWSYWNKVAKLPDEITHQIEKLEHVSIDVSYHKDDLNTDSHWIYLPDEEIPEHRLLVRSNFISGSPGYWKETNSKRTKDPSGITFRNEHAYPVNTVGKPEAISAIVEWAHGKNIYPAGRWGLWEHMNSDIAVSQGIRTAENLFSKRNLS